MKSASLRHDAIDMASVMKASRAISGEIVIDQLLKTVMEILLENAGGQRGYFVIQRDGQIVIVAKSVAEDNPDAPPEEIPRVVVEGDDTLPISLAVTRCAPRRTWCWMMQASPTSSKTINTSSQRDPSP